MCISISINNKLQRKQWRHGNVVWRSSEMARLSMANGVIWRRGGGNGWHQSVMAFIAA